MITRDMIEIGHSRGGVFDETAVTARLYLTSEKILVDTEGNDKRGQILQAEEQARSEIMRMIYGDVADVVKKAAIEAVEIGFQATGAAWIKERILSRLFEHDSDSDPFS